MKSAISSAILALAAGTAFAQSPYSNQSAPFYLKVVSSNATLNGASFISCHEGAAIEGLCLSDYPGDTYYLNTSTIAGQESSGLLVWNLVGSNFVESEPMDLFYSPTSNVALPLFEPQEFGLQVEFDENNLLAVENYVDDTVSPPTAGNTTLYRRWAICQTYYTGYTYTTLSWILGPGPAENPSCQSVDVTRVWVSSS